MAKISKKFAETKNRSYAVGYRKPPLSGRFKKGQSGNPSGRRKRGLTTIIEMIAEELIMKVPYLENGLRGKATKARLMIKQAFKDAMSGDFRPLSMLVKLMDHLEPLIRSRALPRHLDKDYLRSLSEDELAALYLEAVREE